MGMGMAFTVIDTCIPMGSHTAHSPSILTTTTTTTIHGTMRRESSSSTSTSSTSNGSFLRRLSTLIQPGTGNPAPAGTGTGTGSGPSSPSVKPLWLDMDPGHDDAIALLLALHHPALQLLGVSTVAGNASGRDTFANAVRLLAAYRADTAIPLVRGADAPLLREPRVDEGIHGHGGLGGVQGLPDLAAPLCQRWLATAPHQPALHTLAHLLADRISTHKPPINIAVTGPLTNIALFLTSYPHLRPGIAQIVLMGGAAGVPGNRGPLAEFNILNDPEAAAIVFNTDIKVVMAGLNVTHQAIFTPELHDTLLGHAAEREPTQLQRMLSSMLTFFAKTYATEFGFSNGPPVHDMLAVAYIADPSLFPQRKRYRVDVECAPGLACGATVVDFWSDNVQHNGWGRGGRNVEVLEQLDQPRLWDLFFRVVQRAEKHIAASASASSPTTSEPTDPKPTHRDSLITPSAWP